MQWKKYTSIHELTNIITRPTYSGITRDPAPPPSARICLGAPAPELSPDLQLGGHPKLHHYLRSELWNRYDGT